MYYLMMKTAVKHELKLKNFCISKSYSFLKEKDSCLIEYKFYQKLFVLLISFSTILILPESPRELENVCKSFNSKKVCNVW